MNVNNISLPYPVLGIGDDITPLPQITNKKAWQDEKNFYYEISFSIDNYEILDLIKNGYADYVCEIDCPTTFLRKCYHSTSPNFNIALSKQSIQRTISILTAVVVKQNITNYSNKGFHADYEGYKFNLEPGDILAFISQDKCEADVKYDQLKAVGSFMEINEGSEGKGTTFNLEGDKIEILLPPDLYKDYKTKIRGNREYAHIIHSSLVFNALIFALNNFNNHESRLWGRTLKVRIETDKSLQKYTLGEPEDAMGLAQALLGDPYKRLFVSLNRLSEINNNIEEE